jgi:ABC-type transport system involved in multi-copper enzyme maturation permease subunit
MSAFAPLVAYVLRAGRPRRWWVALLPTAIAVLLALLARRGGGTPEHDFVTVVGIAICTVLLPLTCLVVGDAVLGAELRSGTFALTWLSPVPVWLIVFARWFGALLLVLAAVVPAVVVASIAAGAAGAGAPAVGSVVLGAAAYLAVFMLFGAVFRRSLAWSLAFIVIFERFLGAALSSIASLSPSWLSFGLLADWTGEYSTDDLTAGTEAVVRLLVLTAIGLLIAARKVARPRVASGDE